MRGKVLAIKSFSEIPRITPAYAGKRIGSSICIYAPEDHPRLCGEKTPWQRMQFQHPGSPPPMRGKEKSVEVIRYAKRITPAYAGKRSCWSLGTCRRGDHPRLCGEKDGTYRDRTRFVGSPPPMRGKDRYEVYVDANDRITPAYAGKSAQKRNILFVH